MKKLIGSFKNEFQKLVSHKKYIVFIILAVLICFCRAVFSVIVNIVSKGVVPVNIDNYAMKMFGFFIQFFIPLIIFMASCDLFCSEYNTASIKAVLSRPISRFKIYISKALAVFALAAVNLGILFLVSSIIEIIFNGRLYSSSGFGIALSSYLIDLIPILVIVLLVCFINQFVKSPSLAMFLSILIYVGIKFSYMFSGALSSMVITSYIEWHKLWIGVTLPFTSILSKIMLIAGQGIVFLTAGYYMFDKREV